MSARARRSLELLALSRPLGRYALTLQPDANASLLSVHRALQAAFAEAPEARPSAQLEDSLRADIRLHLTEERPHGGA